MDDSCLFCRIARGEIPAKEIHRDDHVVAIEDVNPQAPAHALVLPLRHLDDVTALANRENAALAHALMSAAARLGSELGGGRGFRLVVNTGPDGGQTVGHLHVHVLAGRPMRWPPG